MATPSFVLSAPGTEAWRDLFNHPDQWSQTRRQITAINYADWKIGKVPDQELQTWLAELKSWNIRLQLEVGVLKGWSNNADNTLHKEEPYWEKVQRLGGTIATIAMDEPMRSARRELHETDEYALQQTAIFVANVRRRLPKVKIGDIEPYPHFSVHEHIAWIERLNAELARQHVHGLDFYRVDPNWIEFTVANKGSWQDLALIERYCHSRNLPLSLIAWASDYPMQAKRRGPDDRLWYSGLMHQADAYRGRPDEYVIQSWLHAPSKPLPETDPLSFTGSALAFIERNTK